MDPFNLRDLIYLLTLAIAVGGSWGTLYTMVKELRRDVDATPQTETMKTELKAINGRLQRIENLLDRRAAL